MIISRNWLQKYFDKALPSAQEIAEALTFGVAEIERVEESGHDAMIDVKVLPDRACYLLSHRGFAKEIATLMDIPMKHDPFAEDAGALSPLITDISAEVVDAKLAPYYGIALIRGVKVGPSPQWLKDALESVGQRSINNIVDATNYVMLDLGTPLHAFDARKTSGHIVVRSAEAGETIQLLGGVEKTLTGTETVITDRETSAPLALAGVKGGSLAELTEGTTEVILEAATFDPTTTRKTATKHDVRTDASKRFENHVAASLPPIAMRALVALVLDIAGGALVGYAQTNFSQRKPYVCGVSARRVQETLGVSMVDADIEKALGRVGKVTRERTSAARAVALAREQLGKPYKKRASVSYDAPEAFDCSSLVAWAYAHAGVVLPRISVDQYVYGDPVNEIDLQPGDLIFFNTEKESAKIWTETIDFMPGTPVPEGVSHVVMYAGDGLCIHARSTVNSVVEEALSDIKARAKMVGCRRVAVDELRFVVQVPQERLDIRIDEDLIEEVGRIHGYDQVPATDLAADRTQREVLPIRYWSEVARSALMHAGFIEVLTYSLRDSGAVQLVNALASDKSFLRDTVVHGVVESLGKGEYYAALVGVEDVRLFEIGTVFTHDGESVQVCIGVRAKTGKKRDDRTREMLEEARGAVEAVFGVGHIEWHMTNETCSFDLTALLEKLPPAQRAYPDIAAIAPTTYSAPSSYPFVLRDIALWAPEDVQPQQIEAVIGEHAGVHLVRTTLFDAFKKDGRVSYAFHLVFQSKEKTLSDDEVHGYMEAVVAQLQKEGWEVR